MIHDPKDALSRFIGFAAHDLSDEAIGRSNATLLFTVSEELSSYIAWTLAWLLPLSIILRQEAGAPSPVTSAHDTFPTRPPFS